MTQDATWWEIAAFQCAARNQTQDAMLLAAGLDAHVWQQRSVQLAWHSARLEASEQLWLAVADGVAAGPDGALASRTFLTALHQTQATSPPNAAPGSVVRAAHDKWQARHLRPATQGASTTLAAVVLANDQCTAINCGDSRVWRLRASPQSQTVTWLQLSKDHTAWETLLAEGYAIAGQQSAYASIYGGLMHCLTLGHTSDSDVHDDADGDADADEDEIGRFAEPEDYPKLHVHQSRVEGGDVLLLATDGLHDCLDEEKRLALWNSESSLAVNVRALRTEVLRRGIPDDCTVIACRRLEQNRQTTF